MQIVIFFYRKMINSLLTRLAHRLLEVPLIFELQESLCNDYGSVRKEFLEYLSKDGLKILDVGCGTGVSASVIVDMEHQSYTGIELMPGYAAIAAKRNPKGKVLTMDATKMDFPNHSFDLAFFSGVWHHMDDEMVRRVLVETKRVLKTKGVLLVAEPLFTPGRWYSNMLLKRDRGRHIRTRDGYLALVKDWYMERERTFNFSLHRSLSLVLRPKAPR